MSLESSRGIGGRHVKGGQAEQAYIGRGSVAEAERVQACRRGGVGHLESRGQLNEEISASGSI